MRLFYSQTERPPEGYAFRNPRYFQGPEADVEAVIVYGEWPGIVAAYEAQGVAVSQFTGNGAALTANAALAALKAVPLDERSKVVIPDDWESMPWTARADRVSIRQIAALVSDEPVLRRRDAVNAIRAELERRKAALGEALGE